MKRLLIAAMLACTTCAFAQQPQPEVPKPKCEPKPRVPGERMREDAMAMRTFKREHDAYKKCMTDYLDERKAAIKANELAANAAVDEFNATMKSLNEQQAGK